VPALVRLVRFAYGHAGDFRGVRRVDFGHIAFSADSPLAVDAATDGEEALKLALQSLGFNRVGRTDLGDCSAETRLHCVSSRRTCPRLVQPLRCILVRYFHVAFARQLRCCRLESYASRANTQTIDLCSRNLCRHQRNSLTWII
jgi:hypothetical protein